MKKRMLVHPIGFPMIRCVELDLCGAKTYDIEEGLVMVIEQKKNTIVPTIQRCRYQEIIGALYQIMKFARLRFVSGRN
jgi:hypothetical protein